MGQTNNPGVRGGFGKWQAGWSALAGFLLAPAPAFAAAADAATQELLVLGAVTIVMLLTWKTGRQLVFDNLKRHLIPLEDFLQSLFVGPPQRVDGRGHATRPRRLPRAAAARRPRSRAASPCA